MPPIPLDDDGFVTFELPQPGGPPLVARIDLYEATNAYRQLAAKHPDDLDNRIALQAAWCDWLAGKGLPGLSHGHGCRVIDHVWRLVEEFKKKGPTWTSSAPPDSSGTGSATSPDT